jgi:hypothetical protein
MFMCIFASLVLVLVDTLCWVLGGKVLERFTVDTYALAVCLM